MVARSRLPLDPAAVAPWSLGSGERGALLVHGFAGTPPELRRLGAHLAAHGWHVRAPAVAGHATTPEDLDRTTWRDWGASVLAALDDLARDCRHVAVAGQSMGGALALHAAAVDARVEAVASLATPLRLRDPRLRLLRAVPALARAHRWHVPDPDAVDLFDAEAVQELHSYGRRSLRSILELVRLLEAVTAELPMVRAPVLILHGGRDATVDPANVDLISSGLVCSAAVESHVLPRSGHAVSVDVDREEVNARVLAWFDRFVPAADAQGPSRSRSRRAVSASSTGFSGGPSSS